MPGSCHSGSFGVMVRHLVCHGGMKKVVSFGARKLSFGVIRGHGASFGVSWRHEKGGFIWCQEGVIRGHSGSFGVMVSHEKGGLIWCQEGGGAGGGSFLFWGGGGESVKTVLPKDLLPPNCTISESFGFIHLPSFLSAFGHRFKRLSFVCGLFELFRSNTHPVHESFKWQLGWFQDGFKMATRWCLDSLQSNMIDLIVGFQDGFVCKPALWRHLRLLSLLLDLLVLFVCFMLDVRFKQRKGPPIPESFIRRSLTAFASAT